MRALRDVRRFAGVMRHRDGAVAPGDNTMGVSGVVGVWRTGASRRVGVVRKLLLLPLKSRHGYSVAMAL